MITNFKVDYKLMAHASEKFIKYIEDGLAARNWKQADLARKSGITTGYISQILSGIRSPGVDFCKAIAKAFNVSVDDVLVVAGLLETKAPPSDVRERVKRQLDQLTEEQLKVVERTARALLAEQLLESLRAEPQKPQTSTHRP